MWMLAYRSYRGTRLLWQLLVYLFGQLGVGVIIAGVLGLCFLTLIYKYFLQGSENKENAFPRGCCPQCGYDLTGNESGRCPECGKRIRPPWMFR